MILKTCFKQYFILRNQKERSSSRTDYFALTAIENTVPIKEARASSVTQPIPVPTQVENYEKMQGSRDRAKSLGGPLTVSPGSSPNDGIRIYFV